MANADQELIDLGSRWAAAMVSNDAGRIGSFMADDWVIVFERGISSKGHFPRFVESGQLMHSLFEMMADARGRVYGDTAVLSEGAWLCVPSHITPLLKDPAEHSRRRTR